METFFPDDTSSDSDCAVRKDGATLVVSYADDGAQ